MLKRFKYFFVLVVLTVCASESFAQDTLYADEAVAIALQNSLEVFVATNNAQAAGIENSRAYAGSAPTVGATLSDRQSLTNINQKLNTGTEISRRNARANQLAGDVTANILVFNAGRARYAKQRLEELVVLANSQIGVQTQSIVARTMTAYYDIVRQQSYIKTLDSSIGASNTLVRIVSIRKEAGLANNADLFQAQIDLNALLQQKQQQQMVVSQAKTELMRLLTLKPDSSFLVVDTIVVNRDLDLQRILDSIPNNPELIAAGDQVRVNELLVKEINAQRYPSVSVFGGYGFTRNQSGGGQLLLNQSNGPIVGFTLGVPIFNGGLFRKQTEVSRIDVRSAQAQRDILIRDYKANVVRQFEAYQSALNQADKERETNVLAKKLLDLTILRFDYRQATIVEVKNAQQSFEESGYRIVNLTYAAKVAEIELKRIGKMQ